MNSSYRVQNARLVSPNSQRRHHVSSQHECSSNPRGLFLEGEQEGENDSFAIVGHHHDDSDQLDELLQEFGGGPIVRDQSKFVFDACYSDMDGCNRSNAGSVPPMYTYGSLMMGSGSGGGGVTPQCEGGTNNNKGSKAAQYQVQICDTAGTAAGGQVNKQQDEMQRNLLPQGISFAPGPNNYEIALNNGVMGRPYDGAPDGPRSMYYMAPVQQQRFLVQPNHAGHMGQNPKEDTRNGAPPMQWYMHPFAMPQMVYAPFMFAQQKNSSSNATGHSGSDSDSGQGTHTHLNPAGLHIHREKSFGDNSSSSSRARIACVERYRKKKARRSFAKHIRYSKRKVNADRRPRVKGRFIKVNHEQEDV